MEHDDRDLPVADDPDDALSRTQPELDLNRDPDASETGGLPRVDTVGGHADEDEDRLADSFG